MLSILSSCFTPILLLLCAVSSSAFAPVFHQAHHSVTKCFAFKSNNNDVQSTRRHFFGQHAALLTTALLLPEQPALAKGGGTDAEDKAKILEGYKRLTYLLDNWDNLTTKCGTERDPFSGKQVCEKTPLVVQEYMGYKSINDPLFKAEKTMQRLEALVPPNREVEYFDAVEKWATTADEASGMAYTSSWAGPQNPNGGDDAIAYYLDRAKKQVEDARGVLVTVIDILDLKKQS